MSESLEQRALRIRKEIAKIMPDHNLVGDGWAIEFARRLMAEQGEPVALIRAWNENKCGDYKCEEYRLKAAIAVLTGGVTHKENADKLYAAPSQDALDAKRYRHVRQRPEMLLHLNNKDFDATIDAAM